MKIVALCALISPGISGRACRPEPDPHRVGHSREATQPLIEPTSVTAGHAANTDASHGGL
jgi:hypothetical protein